MGCIWEPLRRFPFPVALSRCLLERRPVAKTSRKSCRQPRNAREREHGLQPHAWSCSGARTRAAAPQPASQAIAVIGGAAAAMPRSQTECCPRAKDGKHPLPHRPQRLQRHRGRSIVGSSGGATNQLQQGELGDAARSVRALRLELPSPEEGDEDIVRQHVRAQFSPQNHRLASNMTYDLHATAPMGRHCRYTPQRCANHWVHGARHVDGFARAVHAHWDEVLGYQLSVCCMRSNRKPLDTTLTPTGLPQQ